MYVPSSPDLNEQKLFLDSGRFKLYAVSSISTFLLIVGMLLFIKLNTYFIPYTIFACLTSFYLIVTYVMGFLGKDFDYQNHREILSKWFDRAAKQDLDIYLPICGEENRIIENTWDHVKNLCLRHEGKIEVYVLDDGHSLWAKETAKKFGFHYIDRGTNELKKAGNLRNAFSQTKGEYFIIFDADFCPSANFILNTLPYMYEDENVSIVQTPQFFDVVEGQTLVQKGAGAIQELFYRLIQVNRNTWKGSICVGTNAVYRRKHLEPFGGTAAIGYSEDVRTGFRLQDKGHSIMYIPINLAKGTCPDKWTQFFVQQYRWSMGSLDLFFSKEFWISNLTFAQKLCYLTGMFYYLTTGLSVLFLFAPSIYLMLYKPEYIHWYNLLWSIPSLVLTNIYMRFWQKTKFTFAAVQCRHVSYYSHLFAIKDILLNTAEGWISTGSTVKSNTYRAFLKYGKAHLLLVMFIVVFLSTLRIRQGYEAINFIPLLVLLFYHVLSLHHCFSQEQE